METINGIPNQIAAGLTGPTCEVFERVSTLKSIEDLYLCGGTGLSVQINHRLSEDLDFELIGTRKDRPKLAFGQIIGELKENFPDAKVEILGDDHFLVFINNDKVKLSFYRPDNPVKSISEGVVFNNIHTPSPQDLLGMKVYTVCVRTVFRDYYDIYSLLEHGCKLNDAISYSGYFSRHQIRTKTMVSRLLSPALFEKNDDFLRMMPKYDISPEGIRARIKRALEEEETL